MKNTLLYTLLLACMLPTTAVMAQQKEYKGKMKVTPLQLEQIGDSLHIGIDFDLREVKVGLRHSISLIPVLIAPNKEEKLPEVVVKGRADYQTSQREVALMSKAERHSYEQHLPYVIMKGYKSKEPKQMVYRKTIAFEPWMKDARLFIHEDLCGCGNKPRLVAESQLSDAVVLERPFIPSLAYVSPEVEAVKRREVVGEAFLDFVVNKIDIRPDYMNNPHELEKITRMINEVRSDKNISVNSISVIGYASPEGGAEINKKLSIGRANALVSYLAPRFDYPRSLYKIEYGAENWEGLKAAVEQSDMLYKAEILAIIDSVPVINVAKNTGRNKALMNLKGGQPYKYLHQEIYPKLRKAICKIDYEVKAFDVAQAKEALQTHPQNLSLNEMYLVANTYEVGSSEFIGLFETAVNMFPDDQTANLNAASAALTRQDTIAAERYLSKVKARVRIPEHDNARGVLALLKGDYHTAEGFLKSAVEAGLESAKLNLSEVQKKLKSLK